MPRTSKTLTPAAAAAFLAALGGGAKVVEAAAAAGVAVSSLYCRRRRDPAFDSAWVEAAAASFWTMREGRRVRTPRRLRFDPSHRGAFLAVLEWSCDTWDSARVAGFRASTVYRHLKLDPDFARANAAALERGYERLRIEAQQERARSAARLSAALDRGPATGRPTSDFDHLIRLLDRWWRPARPPARSGAGFLAPRRRALSFDESLADLETRLRHMDLGPGFG